MAEPTDKQSEIGRAAVAAVAATLDPSPRTIAVLAEATASLKELTQTKFESMQEAVRLLQANADKSPTIAQLHEIVLAAQKLSDERFKGVQLQFREREKRFELRTRDLKDSVDSRFEASKEAVTAALEAQKELVAQKSGSNDEAIKKSEARFEDKFRDMASLSTESVKGTDAKFEDRDRRFTNIETELATLRGQSKGSGDSWAIVAAIISTVVALISMGATIVLAMKVLTP